MRMAIWSWAGILLLAGLAGAQPRPGFEVKGSRAPTAAEKDVIELMNQSAASLNRGWHEEADTYAQRAVAQARNTGYREITAAALHQQARVELARGRIDQARQILYRALLLFEVEGNLIGQSNVRLEFAELAWNRGLTDEAQRQMETASRFAAAMGDRTGVLNASTLMSQHADGTTHELAAQAEELLIEAQAQNAAAAQALALRQIGHRALETGDLGVAEKSFRSALEVARGAEDLQAQSHALAAQGDLARKRNRHEEALDWYRQALGVAERGRFGGAIGNALVRLSGTYGVLGQYRQMKMHAESALNVFNIEGQLLGQGLAHQALGDAALRLGQGPQAVAHYREAIRLARETGRTVNEADAHLRLAIALRVAQPREARREADQAITLYENKGLKSRAADGVMELGRIQGAANDLAGALRHFADARKRYQLAGDGLGAARAELQMAVAHRMAERGRETLGLLRTAVPVLQQAGDVSNEILGQLERAYVLGPMGDLTQADEALQRAIQLARQANRQAQLADALLGRSRLLEAWGQRDEALEHTRQAALAARAAADPQRMQSAQRRSDALRSKP